MFQNYTADAVQQALGFLQHQLTYIEPQVVETLYPDIQYPQLIPVDTSAPEWIASIEYYSVDRTGKADWLHHYAKDIQVADVERSVNEQRVHMANIGYRYTLEELNKARLTNTNLTPDRAAAARRAYEEFVDNVALRGNTAKNLPGIINLPGITTVNAAGSGTGGSGPTFWADKTNDEILADINSLLSGVYTSTLTVEIADTLLLPHEALLLLANRRLENSTMTLLAWILQNNVYTFTTGRPLTVRGVLGLETAGMGGVGRAMAYRRDPSVLKLHIPMTHRFLPVWQTGPMVFDVPGIFRMAGVEARRPGAIRYMDGISDDPNAS